MAKKTQGEQAPAQSNQDTDLHLLFALGDWERQVSIIIPRGEEAKYRELAEKWQQELKDRVCDLMYAKDKSPMLFREWINGEPYQP